MRLRNYQTRAIEKVERCWEKGSRSVVLVAPAGSGKTVMGAEIAQYHKTLWVAHHQELILQAAGKLRALVGNANVGIVMGDHPTNSHAPIQVGTIETLTARKSHPKADLLVLDECHHYEAFSWNKLVKHYRERDILTLGLTATPERRDGRGLGDIFDKLVEAASYSELIEAGYLVRPVIYGPDSYLGKNMAQDPVEAWGKLARGLPTFWFSPSVESAHSARDRLRRMRVAAEVINWETPKGWRETAVEAFSRGQIRVLTNCNCLNEGVDVPSAVVGLSTRAFRFSGTYIQTFGRLSRASPGKRYSIIIDLTGASHVHGSPVDDWEYSLLKNDEPIKKKGRRADSGDDRASTQRGVVLDEELYLLDPGPLLPNEPTPVPRWQNLDLSRAKRLGSRHGRRAALSALRDMNRL